MSTRLIALGTNGFIPTQGRHTMSFLVLVQDQAILLDAGTGVARLLDSTLADLLRPYPSLSIVFSHYHLDHTVGLTYLTLAAQGKPVTIYAPGKPLLHASGEEALNGLIKPPNFPLTLAEFPGPVTVVPVTTNEVQIGALLLRLRSQKHAGGSAGIRIGDDIAYITDTVVDGGTVDFVRGARVLLHELWLDDAETPAEEAPRFGHSFASGVAQIATQAGVGNLMLVHHHPRRSLAQIRKTADAMQASTSVRIIVPDEGTVYEV